MNDAGIYAESHLKVALDRNALHIPADKALPNKQDPFPYCVVGDDAFPLQHNIMKPYPFRNLTPQQRIFNYRLSRARRCVEQAFGVMASRFRVLLSPICVGPDKVDAIILTCCTLHNMLRTLLPTGYTPQSDAGNATPRPTSSQGGHQLLPARVAGRRSASIRAKAYRDYLCEYFSSAEGAVPWQDSMI